jgi:Tfp pilus assembly protein PilE
LTCLGKYNKLPYKQKQKGEMIMKSQESGRSMIEMLGVLAIVGVLSVGGLAGYAQAMQKYKVYKVSSQVADTTQNIIKFYSNLETFDSVSKMAK